LTLEESVQEEKDIVEESGSVKLVYDKDIAGFLDGKTIDFHDGPQGGFSISDPNPGGQCDSGCC